MIRIASYIGLLTLLSLPAGAQIPLDQIEAALNAELKDTVIALQVFYPGEELRFTADGVYAGTEAPGPWTLWSRVKISEVVLNAGSVELKGQRVYVAYHAKKKEFIDIPSKDQVMIAAEFSTTPVMVEVVRSTLDKILLTKNESLRDLVPEEWKGVVERSNHSGTAPPSTTQPSGQQPPFKPQPGVSAPQIINAPDPAYQSQAFKARIRGTVVLGTMLEADGRLSKVWILQPLGMGPDEKAIEAIRNWQFKPARKDGKPVAVQLNIEVNFRR